MTPLTLMIDGDLLVHRSTVAVEKDTRFDERYHILMSDEEDAWNLVEDTITELSDIAGTDEILVTFSDPETTFRKEMASGVYKSNRLGQRKPLCYWDIIQRVKDRYKHLQLDNVEADDVMGLVATKYPEKYVIWSLDKDLKQIPGYHLVDDEIIERTEEDGDRFFYFQILCGDPTDGYSGCPGMGKVRAQKTVDEMELEHAWERIVAVYEKAGQTEKDAMFNAHMARILRHGEYRKGKVKLWTPPSSA